MLSPKFSSVTTVLQQAGRTSRTNVLSDWRRQEVDEAYVDDRPMMRPAFNVMNWKTKRKRQSPWWQGQDDSITSRPESQKPSSTENKWRPISRELSICYADEQVCQKKRAKWVHYKQVMLVDEISKNNNRWSKSNSCRWYISQTTRQGMVSVECASWSSMWCSLIAFRCLCQVQNEWK